MKNLTTMLAVICNSVIKLPYYFCKKLPLIFLLVKYFKFSPQCSGSISGPPPFRCRNFLGPPPPLESHIPPLVIYERSLIHCLKISGNKNNLRTI